VAGAVGAAVASVSAGRHRGRAGERRDVASLFRRRNEERYGEYRTKRIILEIYDAMAEARRTGHPWRSTLNAEARDEP